VELFFSTILLSSNSFLIFAWDLDLQDAEQRKGESKGKHAGAKVATADFDDMSADFAA
jgi:hypothetical protein